MTPARGPSVAPTKPYTLPAWLKRWVSRTKVQAIRSTPIVASANASGTARPTPVSAVPCGLMLAAIEGAISASEIPTASHRCNSRRRCGLSVPPVFPTSVVIMAPLPVVTKYGEQRAASDQVHTHLTGIHRQQLQCALLHPALSMHITLQRLAEDSSLPTRVLTISHATAFCSIAFGVRIDGDS